MQEKIVKDRCFGICGISKDADVSPISSITLIPIPYLALCSNSTVNPGACDAGLWRKTGNTFYWTYEKKNTFGCTTHIFIGCCRRLVVVTKFPDNMESLRKHLDSLKCFQAVWKVSRQPIWKFPDNPESFQTTQKVSRQPRKPTATNIVAETIYTLLAFLEYVTKWCNHFVRKVFCVKVRRPESWDQSLFSKVYCAKCALLTHLLYDYALRVYFPLTLTIDIESPSRCGSWYIIQSEVSQHQLTLLSRGTMSLLRMI